MRIGARFGQAALRRLIGDAARAHPRRIVRRGVLAVAAIRLVPVAPFTLVNLVAGASAIKLVDYLAGTLLGMLPGLIVMSALGHQHRARSSAIPRRAEIGLLALAVAAWIAVSFGVQALVGEIPGAHAVNVAPPLDGPADDLEYPRRARTQPAIRSRSAWSS